MVGRSSSQWYRPNTACTVVFVGFSVRDFSFQTSLMSRSMSWYVLCQGPREHAASLIVPVDYVNKESSSISPASFL